MGTLLALPRASHLSLAKERSAKVSARHTTKGIYTKYRSRDDRRSPKRGQDAGGQPQERHILGVEGVPGEGTKVVWELVDQGLYMPVLGREQGGDMVLSL
jgi:hypothetical protein